MKISGWLLLIIVLAGCASIRPDFRPLSQEELRGLLGTGTTATWEWRASSGAHKGSVVGPWVNPGDPRIGRRRF